MKLFIVCISFFLSQLAVAKDCGVDHLACILGEKIPITSLINLAVWISLGMISFGFILFIGSSIYKSMQEEKIDRLKLEDYDNRLPGDIEEFKMEMDEEYSDFDKR
jgi:hypothetical protein